jgi:hypothetical protein
MFAMAARVFSSFFSGVLQVFYTYVTSVSCFGRILQVFYMDVAKVDQVLHMLQCA